MKATPVIGGASSAGQNGVWKSTLASPKGLDPGRSAVRRSSVAGLARSGGLGSGGLASWDAFEATEADQIVGGADEIACEGGAVESSEAGPTEATDGLHPAEDLLNALPDPLADSVAWVARGPAVDGTPASTGVLGDVRCHAAVAGVSVLVAPHGLRMVAPLPRLAQQLRRHVPFRRAGRLGHLEVDQQAAPILH